VVACGCQEARIKEHRASIIEKTFVIDSEFASFAEILVSMDYTRCVQNPHTLQF
jgi:hypothetical protein